MSDSALFYLSATETLEAFRVRRLSPVEMLAAVIERTDEVNGSVNAFSEQMLQSATEQAREAERRHRDGQARPLEGLLVGVKEEHPIAGRTMTDGCRAKPPTIATRDHPMVERILAAGGILYARTTTPEFCAAGFTHTDLWGITRNPWNTDHSSGGSSGGSGAALAAGIVSLATGSDIAGSIRIPAALNGAVGFKPPYGRVPTIDPFTLDPYCHDGPMARTVEDCALLQDVVSGQHRDDAVSVPSSPSVGSPSTALAGRRVALCLAPGDFPVVDEVREATRAVREPLEAAGAVVEEVELPWSRRRIMFAAWAHYGAIMGPSVVSAVGQARVGDLAGYVQDFIRRGREAYEEIGYLGAVRGEVEVQGSLRDLFDHHDVLVCPTMGVTALPAGEDFVEDPLVVGGVTLDHHFEAALTVPLNMASRCPVLSVPSGLAGDGSPTAVQVVGRPFDDPTVFQVGAAIYAQHPWYREPDWRPVL